MKRSKLFNLAAFIFLLALSGVVVAAYQNWVSITAEGGYRIIRSNGIPNHSYGQFPNRYNPNSIREQNYYYKMPLNPEPTGNSTELRPIQCFGVAVNGVVFDPSTGEFWNNDGDSGWRYEALTGPINLGIDQNNAHVQPSGAYHYHGIPTGLISDQKATEHSKLIGYAADGFPIYVKYSYSLSQDISSSIKELKSSYQIKKGTRSSGPGGAYDGSFYQDYEYIEGLGDLDECNGRYGPTPDYPRGTYYYMLTTSFPFIPRCFKGTADSSFTKAEEHRGGGRPGGRGPGFGPPPGTGQSGGQGSGWQGGGFR